ncbi:substrate-binding periplasmic protein [Suttonella ornithocola]|uniref:Sulfate starvation-induced protein 7 n=1 Tax=Suttonella ornithocola TaxID=279832 RepID=A0A380MR28_9GAMM|nr:transporter substrate-binding domain-containing protein [Suttonella ornithocola]SUO93767.1 Sulfate starvation-induced protein 7 [Suttonella ornithocola]
MLKRTYFNLFRGVCAGVFIGVFILVQATEYRVSMSLPNYAPLNFLSEKSEVEGFEHDVLDEIAKRAGVTFKYNYKTWKEIFTDLDQGQTDLLSSGISITPERKKKYFMSDSYLQIDPVVILTMDPSIEKIDDLVGKKISVKKNTSHEKLFLQLNNGDSGYLQYADSSWLTVKDVLKKEVVATIADSSIASSYLKNYSKFGLLSKVDTSFPKDNYGFVISKDKSELLKIVNDSLSEMKNDGSYDRLVKKWFN